MTQVQNVKSACVKFDQYGPHLISFYNACGSHCAVRVVSERGMFARLRRSSREGSLASLEPRVDDVQKLLKQGATENVRR